MSPKMKRLLPVLFAISFSVLAQPLKKVAAPQLRTESATTRLDSVIGTEYKIYYSYDASGNMVSESNYVFNSSRGGWVGESKQEYQYEGKINKERINYRWNDNASQWQPEEKNTYAYDSLYNRSQTISSLWSTSTQSWNSYLMYYTFYDKNDRQVQDSSLYWSINEMKWIIYMKFNYTYNGSGLLLERTVYSMGDQWRKQSEDIYTYDQMGNMTSKTTYLLDFETSTPTSGSKEEYVYDGSNQNTQYISTILNVNTNAFENNSKNEYTYDKQGNKILDVSYLGIRGSSLWKRHSKTEGIFDGYGNTTKSTGYFWNVDTQQWDMGFKSEIAHDLSLSKDLVIPSTAYRYFDYPLKNAITFFDFYNWLNGNWVKLSTSNYYYSQDLIASLVNHSSSQPATTLYPNPSNGNFTIQDVTLEEPFTISSLQGQPIMQGRLQNGLNKIQTDLPRGMYLFVHNRKATKFIVE